MNRKITGNLSGGLALGLMLGSNVMAVEPCPWLNTEHAAVCPQWDLIAAQKEIADVRAQAAENALKSLQQALMAAQNNAASSLAQQQTGSNDQQIQVITQDTDAKTDPFEERVRALLEKMLQPLAAKLGPDFQVIIDRNYQLENTNDGYKATFAEVAVAMEDTRVDVGPIIMLFQSVDEDKTRITGTLADAIRISDNGEPVLNIAIGSQQIEIVWSEQAQAARDASINFNDINVTADGEEGSVTLASLSGKQQLTINPDNTWSQTQSFAASGILIDVDEPRVSLESVTSDISISGREYTKLMNMSYGLQDVIQKSMEADEPPLEMFSQIGELLGLFDGYQYDIVVNGLLVGNDQFAIAKLDNLRLSNSVDSGTDSSQLNLGLAVSGVDSQMAPVPPNLFPREANIQTALKNIPPNLFAKFVEIGMGSENIDPFEQDAYWQQQLLALLMSSNLVFEVNETYIAAADARADLDVQVKVDANSPRFGTGEVNLRAVGIQTVVDLLGLGQDPGVAPVVAMITAMSNRTEENGKVIDSFLLQLTPEGKLFINQKDMSAFLPQ